MVQARERECIFRGIGLGLEGTHSHLCFPGSHGSVPPHRVEALPLLFFKFAQWWPGHILLGRVAPNGQALCCTIVWCCSGELCCRGKGVRPWKLRKQPQNISHYLDTNTKIDQIAEKK